MNVVKEAQESCETRERKCEVAESYCRWCDGCVRTPHRHDLFLLMQLYRHIRMSEHDTTAYKGYALSLQSCDASAGHPNRARDAAAWTHRAAQGIQQAGDRPKASIP